MTDSFTHGHLNVSYCHSLFCGYFSAQLQAVKSYEWWLRERFNSRLYKVKQHILWRSINLGLFILRSAIEENAYNRMKKVVKWYISGFYKKPKVRRINMCNVLHFAEWCGVFMRFSEYTTVNHMSRCFFSTGVEEALQPHYWRDIPLHVAPSEDQ